MHLKVTVEPIKNGYIVECRGHDQGGERELVYAADEAGVGATIAAAVTKWEPRAQAARAAQPPSS